MNIRPYKTTDNEALNRLKLLAFESGMERMRLDFWHWQFEQNPAGRGSGCVAVEGEQIVGFLGFVPKRIKIEERIVVGAQILDLMVDPQMRGKQLATLLAQHTNMQIKESGASFTFGLPNKNSYSLLTNERVGLRKIFSPPVWVKPLRSFPLLTLSQRYKLPPVATRIATGCVALFSSCFRAPPIPTHITMEEMEGIDDRFEHLWCVTSEAHPVLFVRDSAYLGWRYVRHPVYKYRILGVGERGRLLGFLIVNERLFEGMRVGQLVDWLVEPALPQANTWLLYAAHKWAREQGLDALIAAALPTMSIVHTFRRMGYFPVPRRLEPITTNLIVLPFDPTLDTYFQAPARWFWTWGDSDVM